MIEAQQEALQKGLEDTIAQLLMLYPTCQDTSSKGALRYIYISFLRSSVQDRFPYYRIDCYDEKRFGDLVEHHAYWDISLVSSIIYSHYPNAPAPLASVKNAWALEEIKLKSALLLHECLSQHIWALCEPIFKKHISGHHFAVYFGEYLNSYQKVWSNR